jgi:hypothetical protein
MSGNGKTTYNFMENLPASCPPETATMKAYGAAWRFVNANPPTDADFRSYAAMRPDKPRPPMVTPCRWASCSMFLTKSTALKKLPKPRERFDFFVKISITEKCGFTHQQKDHVDFWRFDTFKPNIIEIEEL